jgi:TIR domain
MPGDLLLPMPNESANMPQAIGKLCMLEGGGSDNGADAKVPNAGPITSATSAVFVSYASQDSVVAEGLCAALERDGIACWIAPRDVRPGDFYADAIVQAINACKMLLLRSAACKH